MSLYYNIYGDKYTIISLLLHHNDLDYSVTTVYPKPSPYIYTRNESAACFDSVAYKIQILYIGRHYPGAPPHLQLTYIYTCYIIFYSTTDRARIYF